MYSDASRRRQPVSLEQAAQQSAPLARLWGLVRESSECLEAIGPMLPGGLRTAVKAGPLEGGAWCLLVNSNAAAAKLRQLVPALQEQLRRHGRSVSSIRIKVQTDTR